MIESWILRMADIYEPARRVAPQSVQYRLQAMLQIQYRVLRFTRRTKGIRKSFSGKLQNFIFLGSSTLPVCAMNLSRISISIGISLKRSLGLSTSGLYLVMKA